MHHLQHHGFCVSRLSDSKLITQFRTILIIQYTFRTRTQLQFSTHDRGEVSWTNRRCIKLLLNISHLCVIYLIFIYVQTSCAYEFSFVPIHNQYHLESRRTTICINNRCIFIE